MFFGKALVQRTTRGVESGKWENILLSLSMSGSVKLVIQEIFTVIRVITSITSRSNSIIIITIIIIIIIIIIMMMMMMMRIRIRIITITIIICPRPGNTGLMSSKG